MRLALALTVIATFGALPLGRWLLGHLPGAAAPVAVLPAPPAAHAQAADVPATGATITLFDNVIDWKTTPSTQIRAVARPASGNQIKGQAIAMSGADGTVRFNLGGGGGGGGGGGNANLVSGDRIQFIPVMAGTGVTATLTVPSFAADADIDGDAVVGRAPAGASVSVVLTHGTSPMTRTATADASGMYKLALAGTTDVSPGDFGVATYTTPEGNVFRAEYAGLMAIASLNSRQISGDATPGNVVRTGIRGAGGNAKGTRTATVQGGGTDFTVGQMGGGGGPGGGGPNAFGPVAVGDTITLTVTSSLPGGSRAIQAVVPQITMQVNSSAKTVTGNAPPGTSVVIEAQSGQAGQPTIRVPATSNPDGSFSASLSSATGLGAGWRVSAVVMVAPGLQIRVTDALEQVTVGVHTNQVSGVADPGQPITVTVKTSGGQVRGTRNTQSGNNATFNTNFNGGGGPGGGGGGTPVDFNVGDIVEVEFISGDPIVLTIPQVTAQTSAAANTVGGEAPAGSTITVVRTGGGGGPGGGGGGGGQTVQVTADAGGHYQADFTGTLDVEPPMNGSVTIRLASGHQFLTSWAAVRMTMEIGANYLSGNGPAGRTVTASLRDQAASVDVAAGDDDVGGGGGPGGGGNNWTMMFQDTLGGPVDIRVGDKVHAVVGDDTFDVTVPELSGVAFIADDIINGKTLPNASVTINVQRLLGPDSQQVTVTADANGNFTHTFPDEGEGAFDIQHNDVMIFQTRETGGHNIISRIAVPGLRLNLDEARLTGSWKPNIDLNISLVSGGKTIRATAKTAADATFEVILMDGANRAQPKTGDVLTVTALSVPGETLTLTIPELTVTGDANADTVGGRATPGGVLQLQLSPTFPRAGGGGGMGPGGGGQNRNTQPTINADGTWTANLTQPTQYNVQTGTRMFTLYREPGGHLVERVRYIPIANIQHGGANVCGFSTPRASVQSSLVETSGQTAGSASGQADYDSSFGLEMVDNAKAPVISVAGQTAKVNLGSGSTDVLLPTLAVSVTWGQALVQVMGPPTTQVYMLRPARQCLDIAPRFMVQGQTNAQGVYNAPFGGAGVDPGDGIEVAMYMPSGHRVYRHVFRSLGQVYVRTDRVAGRATPLSSVTVVLLAPDGTTERARATVKADSDGNFEAHLKNGASAVTIGDADKVRLEASGESPVIQVEKLAFDWSRGDIVTLEATANRVVQLSLAIQNMPDVAITVVTDANGNYKFQASDIPPRAGWTLNDITGVRAVIDTANGHQIVASAGEDVVVPPPPKNKVFMPVAQKVYLRPR